jgi:hypothetical protein
LKVNIAGRVPAQALAAYARSMNSTSTAPTTANTTMGAFSML